MHTMTKPNSPDREFYLRERRTEAGVTQEELAAYCGTSKGMISQIETGYQRYHEDWVRKLAEALHIPQVALFLKHGGAELNLAADPDLAAIAKAWPCLTQGERETVLKMVGLLSGAH